MLYGAMMEAMGIVMVLLLDWDVFRYKMFKCTIKSIKDRYWAHLHSFSTNLESHFTSEE